MMDSQPKVPINLQATARDLLTSVRGRLEGLRAARAVYSKRLAPEFNVLSLLRPDEVRLSSVFADLLDPAGSHAQGSSFWELFVEALRCPEWARNSQKIKVRTEVGTDALERSERRIDVVIELDGTAAVAIENKPWAIDQDRQVADYLAHLKKRYAGKHVLIYLAPDGRSPGESSIAAAEREQAESDGTLRIVGFSELLPWLKACRNASEALSVNAFLASIEQYIRKEFLGIQDMTELDALVGEVTRNSSTIEAAFEIAGAVKTVKQKLLGDLEAQLRKRLTETGQPWTLKADTAWASRYQGFSFHFTPGEHGALRFQFEQSDYRQFFFGITKDPELPHPEGIKNALDQEFGCSGKTSKHWTWYQEFEAPLWDWTLTAAPWLQIANGEMAQMILSLVERAYRRLDDYKLLAQLQIEA